MKKSIYWILGLILIGYLSYYTAANYYSPYQGKITKSDISGEWKCTRSSGFKNGQISINYNFNDNYTYKAIYNISVFGNKATTYEIYTKGRYEILDNIIRTDVISMEFLKKGLGEQDQNYKLLHDAFDPNNKDIADYLILSLNKNNLVFTMDKTVKYTCSK